jgi:hypothetical protein
MALDFPLFRYVAKEEHMEIVPDKFMYFTQPG